jgi:(p)ppGpp synthase/HD superfamily hydrolase
MKYTEKIQRAIKFAAKTHQVYRDQKRKGKEIPYITHPLTVGLILSLAGAKEDVVVAGILHDTIEDSADHKKVSKEMIVERFGLIVADLVESVTEKNRNLSWDERKKEAINNIESFSYDSILLKSADLLSNTTELIDDYARFGDEIFERFSVSKEKTIQHYSHAIEKIISCWDENPLFEDLKNVLVGLNAIM